jgi:hypothetical protein
VLIALTLAMLGLGTGPGLFGPVNGFDLFVGGVGCLLIGLFVFQTWVTARRLASDEPSRKAEWRRQQRDGA